MIQRTRFLSSRRRAALAAALLLPLAAFVGCKEPVDPYANLSPEARLSREVADALGGVKAYNDTVIRKFEIIETRGGQQVSHRWHDLDLRSGAYTLKWEDAAEGSEVFTATFNTSVGSSSITASRSGGIALNPQTDPTFFDKVVKRAWELYLLDTFLIYAPYRLELDNKTQKTYYGVEADPRNKGMQKLAVTYPAGQTDVPDYVFFINQGSKRIETWIAKGANDGKDEIYEIRGWVQSALMTVPQVHKQVNGNRAFQIGNLRFDIDQKEKKR